MLPAPQMVAARVLSVAFCQARPKTAPNKGKNPPAEGILGQGKRPQAMCFCEVRCSLARFAEEILGNGRPGPKLKPVVCDDDAFEISLEGRRRERASGGKLASPSAPRMEEERGMENCHLRSRDI